MQMTVEGDFNWCIPAWLHTTPSSCHSGQLVQLNGMSFFPVSPPLPDANEQGPCSFSFPCHLMLMEHKDDETIMLFRLQDYATSSRKFFSKGYCRPLLG